MPHLIVFSHLRWSFVYQRPQQLMSRLNRHYKILFVEETRTTEGPARFDVLPQAPGLDVLVPRSPLQAPGFHDDQLPVLRPLLNDFLDERGIDDYIVWLYTPMALPLIGDLQPRSVVYDCMDELSAFKDAPRQLRQRETALLKLADLVITGGPSLFERRRHLHPNVHCLPSSVDHHHFAPARLRADSPEARAVKALLPAPPGPCLGFFGVIDERADLALLQSLAEARPDWQIVMVGPVAKIDRQALPRAPNLHWLGMQAYERLPHFVAAWDVCLMPFALNESTRFISPTKTLEYLAGDRPVVSTPVPDVVALYAGAVRIASGAADFVAACEAALNESGPERARRSAAARSLVRASSWDRSADIIHRLIGDTLARGRRPRATVPDHARRPSARDVPGEAPAIGTAPTRPTRQVRHLVIGAGLTGLSAAYHLGNGGAAADTLLVEREPQVGGCCRSLQQDGFTFDHAGRVLSSRDPELLELYGRLLGHNQHWQHREAWIYSKNLYTRYPFQDSLHGLPPRLRKQYLAWALEAGAGSRQPTARRPRQGPPADLLEPIHETWDKNPPPQPEAGASPLVVSMHHPVRRERAPAETRSGWPHVPLATGSEACFGYPLRGGVQALVEGFLPLLPCELAVRTSVLRISPSRRTAGLDDGRSIGFDSLVSTMPLPSLVRACGDEAPPEVRRAAKALRHVSLRCVNLGLDIMHQGGDRPLTDKHWIYCPDDGTVFHRIFVQGNASPLGGPPGGFGLSCEISYSASEPLPCEGAALTARVIDDCRRIGLIGPGNPVRTAQQIDLPRAHLLHGQAQIAQVALIRDWFQGFGIVLAGRCSERAYDDLEQSLRAGQRAARQARHHLNEALSMARAG